jgi:dynein heavy chain
MKDSEPNSDVAERVGILIDHFSYSLYRNVCRSLFEKDKLLYSFLVCTRLMLATDKISSLELRFLLSGVGGVLTGKQPEKPSDWVPDRSWTEILQMAQMPTFADFPTVFVATLPEVKHVGLCACMFVFMGYSRWINFAYFPSVFVATLPA